MVEKSCVSFSLVRNGHVFFTAQQIFFAAIINTLKEFIGQHRVENNFYYDGIPHYHFSSALEMSRSGHEIRMELRFGMLHDTVHIVSVLSSNIKQDSKSLYNTSVLLHLFFMFASQFQSDIKEAFQILFAFFFL